MASSGENAEIIRKSQIVGFEMGGSQITFSLNGFAADEIELLKCFVRFHDGRNTTEIELLFLEMDEVQSVVFHQTLMQERLTLTLQLKGLPHMPDLPSLTTARE